MNTAELMKQRKRVCFHPRGKTLTEQSHKQSCDIRFIMKKAEKTGMLNHVNNNAPAYVDLVSRPTYFQAQLVLAQAASVFESIPAKIRERFKNDPSEFLEFIQNEENRTEMLDLGFTDTHLPPLPDEPQAPVEVKVVNDIANTQTQGDD